MELCKISHKEAKKQAHIPTHMNVSPLLNLVNNYIENACACLPDGKTVMQVTSPIHILTQPDKS